MTAIDLDVQPHGPGGAMRRPSSAWRSYHVFVDPAEPIEAILIDIVEQIRALAPPGASWFFIRYTEDGYHLRVRVRDFGRAAFDAVVAASRDRAVARLNRPVRLTLTDYEPEVQRYGGADAIAENEALFELSSEIALRIIMATIGRPSLRINHAAELMLAIPVALELNEAGAGKFFGDYAVSWLNIFGVSAADLGETTLVLHADVLRPRLARLAASDATTATPGKVWSRALLPAVARFRELAKCGALVSPFSGEPVVTGDDIKISIGSMLTSQLHMLNNRLGLSPVQEYHLACSLREAFTRV
jgi:thiopeptide-type bacteriocin biosynthesis protein